MQAKIQPPTFKPKLLQAIKSVPIPKRDILLAKKLLAIEKLKVLLNIKHTFKYPFLKVLQANLCKYNNDKQGNWFIKRFKSFITVGQVMPLDPDRILVRRRVSVYSGKQNGFQDIIIDRKEQRVQMFLHSSKDLSKVKERCVYKVDGEYTSYQLSAYFLTMNSYFRRKIFNWGTDKLEKVVKEQEKEDQNDG